MARRGRGVHKTLGERAESGKGQVNSAHYCSELLSLLNSQLPSLCKLVQDIEHRLAGNPDQPAKGLIQLEDQENSAGDGKRRDDQSEERSSVGRREYAEAKENDDEP